MSGCEERSGFLFAHECDRLPIGACVNCGKAVCGIHIRPTAEGNLCVTCALAATPATATDDGSRLRDPRATTGENLDDPFTYARGRSSGYVSWDDRDRRAFEHTSSRTTTGVEDDASAT